MQERERKAQAKIDAEEAMLAVERERVLGGGGLAGSSGGGGRGRADSGSSVDSAPPVGLWMALGLSNLGAAQAVIIRLLRTQVSSS